MLFWKKESLVTECMILENKILLLFIRIDWTRNLFQELFPACIVNRAKYVLARYVVYGYEQRLNEADV